MRYASQDWSVTGNEYFLNYRNLSPFYFDLFAHHLRVFPFTHILVLIRILRIEFFDVQVFNVGDCISKSPGNILVMPNNNTGSTRETCTDHVNVSSYQVSLIPD